MTLTMTTQRRVVKGIGNAVLGVMLLWTAIPFYWMVATSLKHDKEIYGIPDFADPAVRTRYAGKRVAVAGRGASAQNALVGGGGGGHRGRLAAPSPGHR